MYCKSPLNYVGGKYKLLPQLLPLFPRDVDRFVDLFAGGLNVALNVDAREIRCNDNIPHLIDLYRTFKEREPDEVLRYVEKQIADFALTYTNEDGFLAFRRKYNADAEKNPLDLFVLVAFSFNHQIRFNSKYEFNAPFGRERSRFNERMRANLLDALRRIRSTNVVFGCADFRDVDFGDLTSDDFVYCDPPYLITTGSYNDGKRGFTGWSEREETDLLNLLDGLNERGIKFALSNVVEHKGKRNELLEAWLERGGYCVSPIKSTYANSNYQTDHTANNSREILATNYRPARAATLFD